MADAKVLLVDDEADFVEALSERLEARGLAVTVATSGSEAVDRSREARFDAIVMDLAMPGMDGIEALKVMREEQPEVQVILLTGHGTLQKGVEAMKLGAMDFLEKPADINVLLEKIREAKSKATEAEEKRTQQIIHDILRTKGW
jgi:DNA-binding NtrC family response regulator